MTITLNNRIEKIDKEILTVSELMNYKNFTFKMIIVKLNGQLVKKEYFSTTQIVEGDEVSILHLISGG